jgi:hypothetical protein
MDKKQKKVTTTTNAIPNLFELNKLKSATNFFGRQNSSMHNQVKGGQQFRINQHKGA